MTYVALMYSGNKVTELIREWIEQQKSKNNGKSNN